MRLMTRLLGMGAMLSLSLAQAAPAATLYALGGANDNQTLYTLNPGTGLSTDGARSVDHRYFSGGDDQRFLRFKD